MRRRLSDDDTLAVMIAAGLEPLTSYPGARRKWRCRCSRCGALVEPQYQSVAKGQGGCITCGHERSAQARRIDGNKAADEMRSAGFEPLEAYPGTSKRWHCRCMVCGGEVWPRRERVVRAPGGCRLCAGQYLSPEDAVALMLAAGATPLDPYKNALTPWRCRCETCGRQVSPIYNNVRRGQSVCAYCVGKRLDPEVAVQRMRAEGYTPLEPYPGLDDPWLCRCDVCGGESLKRYRKVQQGEGGCRGCATFGFDPTGPGVVYLVESQSYFAVKVGVTGLEAKEDRIRKHTARGWTALNTWTVANGTIAESVERAILRWWREDLGIPSAVPAADMPHGGWSETASLRWVDVEDTIARIDTLVDQLKETPTSNNLSGGDDVTLCVRHSP